MPLDPALLRTPSGHGHTLVVPAPGYWMPQLHENMTALRGAMVMIGDQPLARLRREYRTALAGRDDLPMIVLGHQPGFIHPGVWAKHVVADRFARAVGGMAVNLIVDNDVLKTSTLALPFRQGDTWSLRNIRFCSAGAATPFEFIPALPRNEAARLENECRETLGDAYADSMLPYYMECLKNLFESVSCDLSRDREGVNFQPVSGVRFLTGAARKEHSKHGLRLKADRRDWVEQTIAARRSVDQVFGINLREQRVSDLSFDPLLLETMRDPVRFTRAYNEALQSYRERNAIRDSRRPMPDLLITENRHELPWWAVRAGSPRQRLFVERARNGMGLFAENIPFLEFTSDEAAARETFSAALARQSTWSIRPRAITLTLWARLFLADYFIHGIGGAQYDAICDDLIRRYFGLDSPHFACVSTTLYWDPATDDAGAATSTQLCHAIRDLHFNPQRYVNGSSAMREHFALRQRRIDAAQFLARNHPQDHQTRRMAFHRIHEVNAAILEHCRPLLSDLESSLAEAEQQSRQNTIAHGREYFFAAYPRRELERLMAALPAVTDFGV